MIDPLIKKAKMILQTAPYDSAHDFDHHERVWRNAMEIIKSEKLQVDEQTLSIAIWWHDVDKGLNDNPRFTNTSRQLHLPQSRIDAILAIMNQHSFDDDQTTLEGKILFDADKLEYVSLARWKKFLPTLQIDPAKLDLLMAYQKAIADRIIPVYRRLHFETTKQHFAKDFLAFSTWYYAFFHTRLPPLPKVSI